MLSFVRLRTYNVSTDNVERSVAAKRDQVFAEVRDKGSQSAEVSLFTLIKEFGVKVALRREGIPFCIAFICAELLFKFKSFALECLAFLVVWFVLSSIYARIMMRGAIKRQAAHL